MDVDEFRSRLHMLAVDDDPVSLMIIEQQLRHCRYKVTTAMNAETALEMLRARRDEDQFDLVITDVHMPGVDGFNLLELIGLEMDIPVIMLSANDKLETMMKGIKHGARDYLVKPVRLEQFKNLWIHVVKNNMDGPSNSVNSYNDADHHESQSGDSEDDNVANHTKNSSRKKRKEDGTREDKRAKRQRIIWSSQLHRIFVEVVHRLGIDKAVPKKILEVMNVEGITREHVASHLQKYRLYLKKVSTGTYRSHDPFVNETVWRGGNFINTDGLNTFEHNLEHGRCQPSTSFAVSSNSGNPFARMNSSAAFGTHNLLPTQSVQLMNQRNPSISLRDMGSVGYGGTGNLSQIAVLESQLGVSNFTSPGNSNTNICFPSCPSRSSFANIPSRMTFNTSKAFHSGTSSNSSAYIPNGSPPVVSSMEATNHPYRSYASLCMSNPDPSEGNRSRINPLSMLAASSGQNSRFQNQMAPLNTGSNTNSIVMPNSNSAPGAASSIMSALPDIQMYRDVMQNQMLNGEDESGSLLNHQAAVDELNYNNESLVGTSSEHNGLCEDLEDFFLDCMNQDAFEIGDAFMDGDSEFAP